ncbi:MAG: S41 family peptidase [Chloroflexota bacterium]|nr:S41 family peptidase [Chloroflexota bacterium]
MIKRTVKRTVSAALLALLLFSAFAAGNVTGYLARPVLAADSEPSEFAVFWEAWDLVLEYFVDQDRIDYRTMTYGAIQGMLDTLGDQNHTVFFSPETAEQMESGLEGSFEGIGAYVSLENDVFTIIAPILGSPAEEAGILAGDIVLAVDGQDITGMAEWEVISLIRGPAGTPVLLTVLHPEADEPVDVTVVRGRIDIDSVLWARIPGSNLVHLQITQFAGDTGQELRNALEEIFTPVDGTPHVSGIILDLRNNPGGYLQEALRVAYQFLPESQIILHEKDAKGQITTYRSQGRGMARDIPLVVLINPGSASAAEILAGALQENERAKLIGEATTGTGTVLRPFSLSDGSLLRLGVTNWLTPGYTLIKGHGIQPDVKVEQEATVEMISSVLLEGIDEGEMRIHEDRQFLAALRMLNLLVQPRNQAQTTPSGMP